MKKLKFLIILIIFVPFNFILSDISKIKISYSSAVKKAAPAVVSIQTAQEMPLETHPMFNDPIFRFFFGDTNKKQEDYTPHQKHMQQGLGSGVVIDKRGYILTNYHVIEHALSIIIKFSTGEMCKAKIIGWDLNTDLAILKIKNSKLPKNISVISLGNSDTLNVGDIVLAIGNPFGIDNTVTQGIVSALGSVRARLNVSEQQINFGDCLDDLIQTDAAINPGNSGGALIDINGNLIGINIAIVTKSGGNQGIGFAVPINTAKKIMEELISTGQIARGWLGVSVVDLTKDVRDFLGYDEYHGVYVESLTMYGPGWLGGIVAGDIITKINDVIINSPFELMNLINTLEPDKIYDFEIFRDFQFMKLKIKLGQTPKEY